MPPSQRAPKHRSAPTHQPRKRFRTAVKGAALASVLGIAATGVALSTGVLAQEGPFHNAAAALTTRPTTHQLTTDELAARKASASRSSDDRRVEANHLKAAELSDASGVARTHTEDLSQADPRTIAKALLPQYGYSEGEFGCLDSLYNSESGWNIHAANPTSSAYGIPQALPGSKMASAGPNWESNPETQIRWGLGYIRDHYGSPCGAWSFKQGHGWY
ncbi:MAG: lytic transglycosylase domain-containing protein [Marmoricola sp.]